MDAGDLSFLPWAPRAPTKPSVQPDIRVAFFCLGFLAGMLCIATVLVVAFRLKVSFLVTSSPTMGSSSTKATGGAAHSNKPRPASEPTELAAATSGTTDGNGISTPSNTSHVAEDERFSNTGANQPKEDADSAISCAEKVADAGSELVQAPRAWESPTVSVHRNFRQIVEKLHQVLALTERQNQILLEAKGLRRTLGRPHTAAAKVNCEAHDDEVDIGTSTREGERSDRRSSDTSGSLC